MPQYYPNPTETMNARFTTYVNGSPVKITLRPHEPLEHCSGGPDEEGYYYSRTTYAFDGEYVTAYNATESSDCDGRRSSYQERSCPVGLLKSNRYEDTVWITGQGAVVKQVVMLPDWRSGESGQRDYFAEAAGY